MKEGVGDFGELIAVLITPDFGVPAVFCGVDAVVSVANLLLVLVFAKGGIL